MGLGKIDAYYEEAKQRTKRSAEETKRLQCELERCTVTVEETHRSVQQITRSIDRIEAEKSTLSMNLEAAKTKSQELNAIIQEEVQNHQSQLNLLKSQRENLMKCISMFHHCDQISLKMKEVSNQIRDCEHKYFTNKLTIQQYTIELENENKDAWRSKILSSLQMQNNLQSALQQSKYTTHINLSHCPLCEQNIPHANASRLQANVISRNTWIEDQINNIQRSIQELKIFDIKTSTDPTETENKLRELEIQQSDLEAQQNQLKRSLSSVDVEYTHQHHLDLEELQSLRRNYNSSCSSEYLSQLQHLDQQIEQYDSTTFYSVQQSQVAPLTQTMNHLNGALAMNESELAIQRQKRFVAITRCEDSKKIYSNTKQQLEQSLAVTKLHEFWEVAFSKKKHSFRGYCLQYSLDELNSYLNRIINVLADDTMSAYRHPLQCRLNAQLKLDEGNLAFGKRSGGQRRRTNLAIFFALAQLARSYSLYRANYIFLDEIFDTLDESGQEQVMKWIRLLNEQQIIDKVFVITHSEVANGPTIHVSWNTSGTTYKINNNAPIIQHEPGGKTSADNIGRSSTTIITTATSSGTSINTTTATANENNNTKLIDYDDLTLDENEDNDCTRGMVIDLVDER